MSSYHRTIVVELGSSRIKVGIGGESRPRRVFNGITWETDDGSWHISINDGVGARPCKWGKFFRYISSGGSTYGSNSNIATVYEWEQSLYPLFSHILTSVLFVQRPSRHRVLILMNDMFPPQRLRVALTNVVLNYLGIGGLLIIDGGGFAGISYMLDGLPTSINSPSRPKAHLLVDIGTFEARVIVAVTGASMLQDTYHCTMSGYHSFLTQILQHYQLDARRNSEETKSGSGTSSKVTTLQDANAIVQTYLSVTRGSQEATTITVELPSLGRDSPQTSLELSIQPLQKAFREVYLDYTNPSSLIYSMLKSVMASPIDYRRVALQNVLLLGGGSTILRYFSVTHNMDENSFSQELIYAAQEACGINIETKTEIPEEKKDDDTAPISLMARERFNSLKAAVSGTVGDSGQLKGGMSVCFPDPFSADLASWIGGSIMGSLDLKSEEWLTKATTSGTKE